MKRGEHERWAVEVKGRLAFTSDCCAYDVVYHNVCNSNFRSGYGVPKAFFEKKNETRKSDGRLENPELTAAIKEVCHFIECGDYDQVTVQELASTMDDLSGEAGGYTAQYLKKKLKETFGEDIIFTDIQGKLDIVSLKRTASKILHDFFVSSKKC